MASYPVIIDIVSDIVCPWCWFGKKHLDQAIEQNPELDVRINWHPFMLDPTVPESGVPYTQYMKQKFGDGPSDKFKSMRDHLEAGAGALGIRFRFDGIPMRPNTLKAHCLMKWAHGQRIAHQMSERLFKAFFDENRDVGDVNVLAEIAAELGMDQELVKKLLRSGRDREIVQAELDYFRNLGISGVPFFIYNGQFSVQGGQPYEVHDQALKKAIALPPKDVMSLLQN
ncbi:MAG: DsbA family oxidoreductase [Acidimicrobiales bacterium]|nr:DsbA family oxidoreductase [Hyphomonadaceae bacterium]RZV42491.1 MAG: DsbA family oxidoreductase [Acidimicrobiales bacterium]